MQPIYCLAQIGRGGASQDNYSVIEPVGKLLFPEKKSILVTGTAPFSPLRSFFWGYNSVNIVVI